MDNYKVIQELRHLASGDYDEQDFNGCGSKEDHLKYNTCPMENGVIGDCHYEIYVQQTIIISAEDEDDAEIKAEKIFTIDALLNEYLKKKNVSEFAASDFEGEIINCQITKEPEKVGMLSIVHEKLYYDNNDGNGINCNQCHNTGYLDTHRSVYNDEPMALCKCGRAKNG
jgi:hypothetical protein